MTRATHLGAFVLAIFLTSTYLSGTEGLKFAGKKYVVILTMNTPKGPIGKIKVQLPTSAVAYSCLTKTSLIRIDKDSGKLILLKNLDKKTAAQFNNTKLVIQAKEESTSGKVTTVVIIIILSDYYGDFYVGKMEREAKRLVRTNDILKTRSGKQRKITAAVLLRVLRRVSGSTKAISMAQVKLEKTIEMIKEAIVKHFESVYGKDAVVYAFLHIKHLVSKKMMKDMEDESECHKPRVVNQCPLSSVFSRTIDGTCNNLRYPNLGASDRQFTRLLPAQYFDTDGLNDPIGYPNQPNAPDVPSPFLVSRDFIKDEVAAASSPTLTHAVMQFGQFVDHDLDLVVDSEGSDQCVNNTIIRCDGSPSDFQSPCYPIRPLPNSNTQCIRVIRSAAVCQEKGYPKTREQINVNTAYFDASQIYGSSKNVSDSLRQTKPDDQGLLRTSRGIGNTELLPIDTSMRGEEQLCRDLGACFIAGDARSNEQQALAAFHTLFLREHNRMARQLKSINPHWNGEKIYQTARKIMGAIWQKLVFYDYLPLILGPKPLPRYKGYNRNVNPGVSNEFATAAFRFGHSTIRPEFDLLNKNFDPVAPAVNLRFMFFNNTIIQRIGVEPLLLGLLANNSENVDRVLSPGIVRHLFERENSPAQNLAALNIQRSRDHGLRGYNAYRKYCKLSDAKTFKDTKKEIKDPENRRILASLYNDDPNLAELWVAGLAEAPVTGAILGPSFSCIIRDQFLRARDGDRFYYKRPGIFSKAKLIQINKHTLSRIYCDNVKDIVSIQKNAFLSPTKSHPRVSCENIPGADLCVWKEDKYFRRPCLHGIPLTRGRGKNRKCKCDCVGTWSGNRCERRPAKRAVPWHATIISNGKIKCSGALVSSLYVLTTRGCVVGLSRSKTRVRLGDYRANRKDRGEKTVLTKWIKTIKNSDIALIRLKVRVRRSKNVKPVSISGLVGPIGHLRSYLSCWGAGRNLLQMHLTVTSLGVCRKNLNPFNYIKNFCTWKASFPYVTSKLAGSPLVQYIGCRPRLVGLLNDVEKVASPRDSRFGYFIKPATYLWLRGYRLLP